MNMSELKDCLGKRIKELREKRGLTQQQLAEMADIEQRNVSKIECGNTFPSRSLAAIAQALDVSLPNLFDFNHVALTPEMKKKVINKTLDILSDENVEIIYRLIQTMYQ